VSWGIMPQKASMKQCFVSWKCMILHVLVTVRYEEGEGTADGGLKFSLAAWLAPWSLRKGYPWVENDKQRRVYSCVSSFM